MAADNGKFYVGVNNVAQTASKIYLGVNGVAKCVYDSGASGTVNLCGGCIVNSKLGEGNFMSSSTRNMVLSGSGCFDSGTYAESSSTSAASIKFSVLQSGVYYVKARRVARNTQSVFSKFYITPSGGSRTDYTSTLVTSGDSWVEHTFAANDLISIIVSSSSSNANYFDGIVWIIMKKNQRNEFMF